MKRFGRLFNGLGLGLVGALGLLVVASAPVTLGCDGGTEVKVANVTPGEMPQGAEWTGVYYSELYGYLHLVQDGTNVQARWLRPSKDKWGELRGKVTGDVIRFDWTEHTVGVVGPAEATKGKGYFKYKRPAGENVDDTIVGEIGRNDSEAGSPWDGVKQRNVAPDIKSIGGSAGASDIGGGDWDKDNKQPGSPEPPKQP